MAHEDWDLFAIVRSCKGANFTTTPTTTTTTQTPLPTTSTTTTTTNITRSPSSYEDTTTTTTSTPTFIGNQENGLFYFPNNPITNGFQELNPLLMTFNPTTTINNTTTTSGNSINPNSPFHDFSGSIGQQQHHHHNTTVVAPTTPTTTTTNYTPIGTPTSGFERFHHHQHSQQQHVQQSKHIEEPKQHNQQLQVQMSQQTSSSIVSPKTQTPTPKSRKRKSQQKKIICHVTADNLSSDLWAWRKYGQKPIKGSPYPRNYYRCSSCKGCAARKQVERSTTEPDMFILTYTGEHKHPKPAHRNSLAGSTRNKPSMTRLPESQENGSPSSMDVVVVSPTQPITKSMPVNMEAAEKPEPESGSELGSGSDDDEEDVLIPNAMGVSEDVFLGPNGVPGLCSDCAEPGSGNNRLNPG